MRRRVWVVLGLMGLAPVGALAEETQRQPTEQTRGGSQGISQEEFQRQLAVLRQDVNALNRDVAALRAQRGAAPAASATGGSGQAGTAPEAAPAADTGATANIGVFGPVGSDAGISSTGGGTQAQSGMATTGDTDTSGVILEIPRGGVRIPGIEGARRSQASAAGPATGGSGRGVSTPQRRTLPNAEVFVGRVRTVTPDRLLMQDPNQRVYEFSLSQRAQVLGPNGARVSLRALREGTPVRTVTVPGAVANQIVTLQVLPKAPAQCR